MKLETMTDLYVHSLKDMHNAEKQLIKALPKLAKGSDSEELRAAFQGHLEETKTHVERLEQIIASLDKRSGGVVCHGMKGLVEEGAEVLDADGDPEVLDAGLIQAAQKVEHYEIASYGCLREFAKLLGRKQDVKLLEASLEEEKAADVKLTELAMGMVNSRSDDVNVKQDTRQSLQVVTQEPANDHNLKHYRRFNMHSHTTMIQALRLCAVASLSLASLTQTVSALQPEKAPRLPSETAQPVDPKMPREETTMWQDRAVVLIPVSSAIGKDIISSTNDEKIGSVGDLLVSPRYHRIAYVLVSRGGVAGIGAKTYAVPFSAFTWNDDKRKLVLPITKETLESAPALSGDDWKMLLEKDRSTPLFEYYNVPVPRREWRNEASTGEDVVGSSSNGAIDNKEKPMPPQPTRDDKVRPVDRPGDEWNQATLDKWPLLKCSEIKGQTLLSNEASELGTIKDVIIDCTSGRVAFGAVGFGGVLGIGDKMVLIPWDLFRVNAEGKVYATTLDPEMIKAAPRVDHDDWRQLREGTYAPGIYRHFNRDATWLERGSTDSTRTLRNDRFLEYDRLYTTGTTVDVTGLVMLVEPTRPMKDMPEVTSIAMTTDEKETYVIHLAPDWYLKDQGLALKAGDRASFKGRWVTIDGKEYFVASQVTPIDGKVYTLRRTDGTRSWTWR